jgi:hypothetical protein
LKKTGRSSSSKSILFLSDMHVGSETAVCSENPLMKGGSYNPNTLQKQLLESWYWCKDQLKQQTHILCLNGEPVDGSNPKQLGEQSWSTTLQEQLEDAKKLLATYNTKYIIATRGSNYHSKGETYSVEEDLAKDLNAIPYSGYHDVKDGVIRTDYYATFRVFDRVFSVTHHIGFNRWFAYRTTALAREMADMEFLRGRYWSNEDMPTIIVRSHVHYFVYVRFSNQHGFTTAAWKLPDSHLFRGGLGGTAPSIGTVEVIIEPNNEVLVYPHIINNDKYPKHNILDLTN